MRWDGRPRRAAPVRRSPTGPEATLQIRHGTVHCGSDLHGYRSRGAKGAPAGFQGQVVCSRHGPRPARAAGLPVGVCSPMARRVPRADSGDGGLGASTGGVVFLDSAPNGKHTLIPGSRLPADRAGCSLPEVPVTYRCSSPRQLKRALQPGGAHRRFVVQVSVEMHGIPLVWAKGVGPLRWLRTTSTLIAQAATQELARRN